MDVAAKDLIRGLLNAQRDSAAQAIAAFAHEKTPIYIFGAGVGGKLVKQKLNQYHIPVCAFVDNNAKITGCITEGVPVISFQALLEAPENKTIVIGSVEYHNEIAQQCLLGGIQPEQICYADFLHYEGQDTIRDYFNNNIEAIAALYGHCADEESKYLLIQNLQYQFHRDRRRYEGIFSVISQQYYEPEIIHLEDNEVYFDCGAKDGDTALAFHKAACGKYKKVLAFEPDAINFKQLQDNTKTYTKISGVNAGVGEAETTLPFDGARGGHSSFASSGDLQARIVPLDDYFSEHPTFIKMDIEGFELSALMGAKKILRELRPKLAICVYHKPCDIVSLPSYILEQRSDYKIFFRLYRDFGHDLVCYCV